MSEWLPRMVKCACTACPCRTPTTREGRVCSWCSGGNHATAGVGGVHQPKHEQPRDDHARFAPAAQAPIAPPPGQIVPCATLDEVKALPAYPCACPRCSACEQRVEREGYVCGACIAAIAEADARAWCESQRARRESPQRARGESPPSPGVGGVLRGRARAVLVAAAGVVAGFAVVAAVVVPAIASVRRWSR